ncbi:hypothetical protein RclHR1_01810014 [Rhizophagus clarus]|uniref:Protein kinase domain-containing protein n=1 Tax=Rhizophagus clarus TaxID=94130 RepID=A0A2Z6R228_9GLOM|nr:hypothetical protein RclHR1_01810014 [Rhizophagus clarus]
MELSKDYDFQNSNNNSVIVEEPHILLEEDEGKFNKRVITLYGMCMKCKQQRSHYQWCQSCERKQCEENFVNWTSGNKEIDKFLQDTQLNSTKPQTFLEWIPFEKLKNINILDTIPGNTRSTIYSAIWKDGPRMSWNQENVKYERIETKVAIELYNDDDDNQIKKILSELKIYLDCHAQYCALLFQFYGISKQPDSNDYFIVKQFPQNNSLADYISQNFDNLDWETKLHLLLYLAEDLRALHSAGYVHRYLHPFSVLVFDNIGNSHGSSFNNFEDNCFCAIGGFSRCCKDLALLNTEEISGWQHYMAPEYLRYKTYSKASDIYAFGMIMHTVDTGYIPYYPLCIDHYLTIDIVQGLRPKISHNVPGGFENLIERCWNTEASLRPNIHEIYSILLNLWSSINRNKRLNSLNSISLEFLAADNIEYSKTKSQGTLSQKIEYNKPKDMDLSNIINLEPSEMINFIRKKNLVKFINKDELTTMKKIDSGHFGNLSVQEYWLIMEHADGGNLRQYLKHYFSKLTWDDKIRLAYQIAEGIKFLQGEKILHRDLHSGNIVIHQGG